MIVINPISIDSFTRDMAMGMSKARKNTKIALLDRLLDEGKISTEDHASAKLDIAAKYSDEIDAILELKR